MIQIRESTSCVRVCESRSHPVFNQSSGGSFQSYAISVAFARWNFLLHAAKKNNNAAKFFVSLMQNNRPLPSSENPHFQNEARCTTILVKMNFICMRMKNDFHIKG